MFPGTSLTPEEKLGLISVKSWTRSFPSDCKISAFEPSLYGTIIHAALQLNNENDKGRYY